MKNTHILYNVMSSIDVEQDVCEEEPDRYDVWQCRKDKEEGRYEEEPRGVVRIKDMKGFLDVMNSWLLRCSVL
jgi:hypothetical protein